MSEDKTRIDITDGDAAPVCEEEVSALEDDVTETSEGPDCDETPETSGEAAGAETAEAETAETAEDEASGESVEDSASDEHPSEDKEAKAESERYMRLMAEFQNYKKRVAREKSDIHAYANENIMGGLLEVLDNFERALASDPSADAEGYAKGMELILTKMLDVLTKAGLEEIKALGEDFDPSRHNAVMTEDTEDYESGKVSKVLQKGYTLNGKVIRPTMVAVAN